MSGPQRAIDRLPFALPDFTRHSWAGSVARNTWESRLVRIRSAWPNIEWLSILDKVRSCALVGLPQSALSVTIPRWSFHRLSALGLPINQPETHPGVVSVMVGALEDITRAREAWMARDDDELGCLLGYPECCRNFFREVWVGQQSLDTTWAMATNTTRPNGAAVILEPNGAPLANILWRWIGVRAVPHLPCRFDCTESIQFGERMLRVGERAGYAEEVQWIREILSWPVEWSALHGIAEVKTPILKISTRTDATASKYVVRWIGSDYPQDGATGLRFPYRAPARRPPRDDPVVHLGPDQLMQGRAPERNWYHLDKGFSSLEVMTALHRPVVALARQKLDGVTGNVLDLGCGNGALLAKICHGRSNLTPYGLDMSNISVQHAALLLPNFAANFKAIDFFNCEIWSMWQRFALTLLMAGRLLEVKRPVADRLIKTLKARSDAILVYLYPDWEPRSLASVTQAMGLQLAESANGTAGLLR